MIDIAELTETNMIRLPASLSGQFHVSDRFLDEINNIVHQVRREHKPS